MVIHRVLGIESSCDETGIAVVDENGNILANILYSQIEQHKQYGGVVPELASRAHLEIIHILIKDLVTKHKIDLNTIDAFCATSGPGLMGGLLIGMLVAKTLAMIYKKPFIAINHLQAHCLMPTIGKPIQYPHLLLLVSGGHSQFLICKNINDYIVLGDTLDDAMGEAFDKSARLLGLGYPGGAEIEKLAKEGNAYAFDFPKPLYYQKNCNFSFSGLKTAVKQVVENVELNKQNIADICASLQRVIVEIVINRTENAIKMFEKDYGKLQDLVISGGVSANLSIQKGLQNCLDQHNINLLVAPLQYCTDNGAMIAWCGMLRYKLGLFNNLDFQAKSRWSLENL